MLVVCWAFWPIHRQDCFRLYRHGLNIIILGHLVLFFLLFFVGGTEL